MGAQSKPKGLVPKTVRHIHQIIGSVYSLAIEQNLITKNPTQGCALPKIEHQEMKTLTAEQLSAFFREAKENGVYELYYLSNQEPLTTIPKKVMYFIFYQTFSKYFVESRSVQNSPVEVSLSYCLLIPCSSRIYCLR